MTPSVIDSERHQTFPFVRSVWLGLSYQERNRFIKQFKQSSFLKVIRKRITAECPVWLCQMGEQSFHLLLDPVTGFEVMGRDWDDLSWQALLDELKRLTVAVKLH